MSDLFTDALVVYPSAEDSGRFVAHSLRTDQIGVDDNVEGAVYELFLAIKGLFEERRRDPRVVIEKPAPAEIQQLYVSLRKTKRRPLPDELMTRIFARLSARSGPRRSYSKTTVRHSVREGWRLVDSVDVGLVPA